MRKQRLLPLFVLSTLLLAGCVENSPSSSESASANNSEETSLAPAPESSQEGDSAQSPSSEGPTSQDGGSASEPGVPSSSENNAPSSEEEQTKTVILSRANGGITGTSYSSQEKTNSAAQAQDGSPFSVTYTNGIKPNGDYADYYGQFKKSAGTLHNTNSIHKLVSIKVNYTSGSKAQYCFSSTANESSYKTLESGVTYQAHGESYFFIKAGDRALYIDTIEIVYGGTSLPDSPTGPDQGQTWDTNYSSANVKKASEVNKNMSLYDLYYNTPNRRESKRLGDPGGIHR